MSTASSNIALQRQGVSYETQTEGSWQLWPWPHTNLVAIEDEPQNAVTWFITTENRLRTLGHVFFGRPWSPVLYPVAKMSRWRGQA